MNYKILPCPLCNSENLEVFENDFPNDKSGMIACKSCCLVLCADTLSVAVKKWNARKYKAAHQKIPS